MTKRLFVSAWMLVLPFYGLAQAQAASRIRSIPIDVMYRGDPIPVRGDDGSIRIVYNVILTNWGLRDLRLKRVTVSEVKSGAPLTDYDTASLEDPFRLRTTLYVNPKAVPENRLIRSAQAALLTVELELKADKAIPSVLYHTFSFDSDTALAMMQDDGSLSTELVTSSTPLRVSTRRPVVLSAPLRGGGGGAAMGSATPVLTLRCTCFGTRGSEHRRGTAATSSRLIRPDNNCRIRFPMRSPIQCSTATAPKSLLSQMEWSRT